MREHVHRVIKHPLISGSIVILAGTQVTNLVQFVFNLAMGRMLTQEDYGILIALTSIFTIVAVFSVALTTVFAKFTASYVGQKKEELLPGLFRKGTSLIGFGGFLFSFVMILFGKAIANFLHIENTNLVYFIIFALFFSFLASVPNGVLQGQLRVMTFSIFNLFTATIKFGFGLWFVFHGFKVFGAVIAVFLSIALGYLLLFLPLKNIIFTSGYKIVQTPGLSRRLFWYALPVFGSSFGLATMTSSDIILVKHYFDPTIAGQYAAISLIGRAIFYVVAPIIFVFFPLIAQKKERKEKLLGTLLLSIVMMGVPCMVLSTIYFLVPDLVRFIFFPAKEYAPISQYLGQYSLFIFLFSLSNLISNFYLAIGNIYVFLITVIGALFEILAIILFHQTISAVITAMVIISFLLLLSLLLYYPYATKEAR